MQDIVAQSNAPRTSAESVPLSVSAPAGAASPQQLTRREIAGAALGCALVVSLFLGPALFTGRFFSPADLLYTYYPWSAQQPAHWPGASNLLLGDSIYAYEPWFGYSAQRLHAGALPLWNPSNGLGVPLIGNMQSQVFFPLNWPYFLWPGGAMLVLRPWLELFIAALGMYVLAREVGRVRPLTATLAAITFTFGASITVWLLYTLVSAVIWLPWLWWATARLISRPRPRQVAMLAVVVALQFLAGHPETSYHMALLTGLFALFQLGQTRPLRLGRVVRVAGAGLLAYGLGTGVAAVQLLPFLEYSNLSAALHLRGVAAAGSVTAAFYYLWTLISPDWFGNPAHNVWWPPQLNYNESNNYSGVLPLILAPFALFVRDRRQRGLVVFLLILTVVLLGIIYNPAVAALMGRIVPAMALTFNFRLVFMVQFALGLLAALGAEAFLLWAPRSRRLLLGLLGLVLVILLLGGVGVPGIFAHNPFPLPADNAVAARTWQEALTRATVLILLSGGVVLVLFVLGKARPGPARWAFLLLPGLLLADLWQAHADYNPTVAPGDYYPVTAVTRFLQQQPGLFRVGAAFTVFAANTNLVYGLSSLRSYDAVTPLSYAELAERPEGQPDDLAVGDVGRASILSVLNVRYVITAPGDDPNYGMDIRQDTTGSVTVEAISGSYRIGQTFVARYNNLAQIQVLGATFAGHAAGTLIFHLKTDPAATTDLVREEIDSAKLPNNTWWVINFPAVRAAEGRPFYFYFEAPSIDPSRPTTVWYNPQDVYPDGTRVENGRPAGGDLVFRVLGLLDPDQPWFTRVLDGGDQGASVYENQRALPRAWLVHRVEWRPDPAIQLRRLNNPVFDRAHVVVLAEPLPATMPLPATPPPTSADTVMISDYQPEAVRITTNSPAAGLLVLSDQAFPGWEARVDGQPTPIVTADHALRSVYVPAGAHTVDFVYQPVSFTQGAVLTSAALVLIMLLAWYPRRLRRNGAEARMGGLLLPSREDD